jgi:acetate kinase
MTDVQPELNMLALNSGSSSLKLGLYRVGSFRTEMLLSGAAELIGEKTANSSHKIRAEPLCFARRYPFPANGKRSYASEDFSLTPKCRHRPPSGIESCMADQSSGSIVSDDSVLRQLEAAIAFAPVHMPSALSIICFAQEHFPGLPQVASFDTTFHADLPEVARVLPISRELQLEGIQRYGFHGLSCESIVRQLAKPQAATRSRAESIPSIPSIFI